MKVKELIEELRKLDPDKGIWCIYDSYALIDLVPDTTADKEDAEFYKDMGVQEGDYIINAS
jgi:hypothetical protein